MFHTPGRIKHTMRRLLLERRRRSSFCTLCCSSDIDGRLIFISRSVPDEGSALAASRAYATHPHIASSTEDFEDSKVILKLFQDEFSIPAPEKEPIFPAGTEASRNATLNIGHLNEPAVWIDIYHPVLNTPLDRTVQILGDDGKPVWDADLVEDGDPFDPDAAKYRDVIPTFHGFSKNGSAEVQLIYANHGTKEDYDELDAKGANFTGKIVLFGMVLCAVD